MIKINMVIGMFLFTTTIIYHFLFYSNLQKQVQFQPGLGENRRLVTDEPVEFEK